MHIMTNHHTHTHTLIELKDTMRVLYVQCWNTVKVWKITQQHIKLSDSLSGSLPPELDIRCITNSAGLLKAVLTSSCPSDVASDGSRWLSKTHVQWSE